MLFPDLMPMFTAFFMSSLKKSPKHHGYALIRVAYLEITGGAKLVLQTFTKTVVKCRKICLLAPQLRTSLASCRK